MAKKKMDELDTETTFADMDVEGFSWYNPDKKKGAKPIGKLSKKEYWAMVKGMFAAMLPMILCIIGVGIFIILLAYFWLK